MPNQKKQSIQTAIEFLSPLGLEHCISQLQALTDLYKSISFEVSVVKITDGCYFDLRAIGVSRSTINFYMAGNLHNSPSDLSTIVQITEMRPSGNPYLVINYISAFGAVAAIILTFALNNLYLLLGVLLFAGYFTFGFVSKYQDKNELLSIIKKALHV